MVQLDRRLIGQQLSDDHGRWLIISNNEVIWFPRSEHSEPTRRVPLIVTLRRGVWGKKMDMSVRRIRHRGIVQVVGLGSALSLVALVTGMAAPAGAIPASVGCGQTITHGSVA
ncbi:MAG: hypothetical protein M3083_03415 [Actinomycetota bacterium]|nr:hypothetical protein [Actinomycetota bacterium]MDQ6947571.1 hypothetical protein [Actinomycetota bacterium]